MIRVIVALLVLGVLACCRFFWALSNLKEPEWRARLAAWVGVVSLMAALALGLSLIGGCCQPTAPTPRPDPGPAVETPDPDALCGGDTCYPDVRPPGFTPG